MAQRTGAERLLASPAKTASVGVALALAVAALALAGCGGGGGSSASTGGTDGATTAALAGTDPAAKGPAPDAKSSAAEKSAKGSSGKDAAPGTSGSGSGQGGGGKKQGPRIVPPKGPQEQAPGKEVIANATVADISLQSPVIAPGPEGLGNLPATYTCDGKDSWPELRWQNVPAGTAELILYAMSVQPDQEGLLVVNWALGGLDPSLEGIEAGALPKGAVAGTNAYGKRDYEICPSGSGEIYMFAVYALPRALSPKPGFDAREFRHQILEVSGNVGLLPAVYARG